MGIVQTEEALELVTVGVFHDTLANGPCQFLSDGVAKLPAADVVDAALFANHEASHILEFMELRNSQR